MRTLCQCFRRDARCPWLTSAVAVMRQRTHHNVVAPYRCKWGRYGRRPCAAAPQPNAVDRQVPTAFARVIYRMRVQQHLHFGKDTMPARAVGALREEWTHVTADG